MSLHSFSRSNIPIRQSIALSPSRLDIPVRPSAAKRIQNNPILLLSESRLAGWTGRNAYPTGYGIYFKSGSAVRCPRLTEKQIPMRQEGMSDSHQTSLGSCVRRNDEGEGK